MDEEHLPHFFGFQTPSKQRTTEMPQRNWQSSLNLNSCLGRLGENSVVGWMVPREVPARAAAVASALSDQAALGEQKGAPFTVPPCGQRHEPRLPGRSPAFDQWALPPPPEAGDVALQLLRGKMCREGASGTRGASPIVCAIRGFHPHSHHYDSWFIEVALPRSHSQHSARLYFPSGQGL